MYSMRRYLSCIWRSHSRTHHDESELRFLDLADSKIPVPIAATQVEAVSRRAREQWTRDSAAASPRSPARSLSPSNETIYASGRVNSLDSLDHRCRCRGCNEWILGKRYQCANCPSYPESYSLVSSKLSYEGLMLIF